MGPLIDTFITSLVVTIVTIGFWYEILNFSLYHIPLAIFPNLLLCVLIYFLRVPRPSCAQVQRVIGRTLSAEISEDDSEHLVMKAIAHRGAGLDAPENTLTAFKMCAEKGCHFIMFNVKLTADEVPVVFHDENVVRLTNLTLIINQTKYENLKSLDVSEKHPLRDLSTISLIPTLDETMRFLIPRDQHMFIDIRDNNSKMVKTILDLYKAYPQLFSRAVVSSFYPRIIHSIRRANPRIVCSLAFKPYYFSYSSYSTSEGFKERTAKRWYMHRLYVMLDNLHLWFLPRITYYFLGISLILLHKDCINQDNVRYWMQRGVRVVAWPVNHPIEKQYFVKQVRCSYITDTLVGENFVQKKGS